MDFCGRRTFLVTIALATLVSTGLVHSAAPELASGKNWPIFRGDSTSSGVAKTTLPDKLEKVWEFKVEGGAFDSTAAIVDGVVYIGDMDGELRALNLVDGKEIWKLETDGGFLAAPAVKDVQLDIELARDVEQVLLRHPERPTDGDHAAAFAAVGETQHDHLLIAARAQMAPIDLVAQQSAQRFAGVREILDRLEERRDVDRHIRSLRPQVPPAREQQRRQHVIGPACHADDVRSDRGAAVFAPTVRNRLKDAEDLARFGTKRAERRLAPLERIPDPRRALVARERKPSGLIESGADDAPLHVGVLPQVQRREMEPERLRAAQQALDGEEPRVLPVMRTQARGDELDVRDEVIGRLVRESRVVVGRLDPRRH